MEIKEIQEPIVLNLEDKIEFAKDGIISKVIFEQKFGEVTLFAMSAGQSISEHTASIPAVVHVLRGVGEISLGEKTYEMFPGAWFYMPAKLPHALFAKEELVFLLTMFETD